MFHLYFILCQFHYIPLYSMHSSSIHAMAFVSFYIIFSFFVWVGPDPPSLSLAKFHNHLDHLYPSQPWIPFEGLQNPIAIPSPGFQIITTHDNDPQTFLIFLAELLHIANSK